MALKLVEPRRTARERQWLPLVALVRAGAKFDKVAPVS